MIIDLTWSWAHCSTYFGFFIPKHVCLIEDIFLWTEWSWWSQLRLRLADWTDQNISGVRWRRQSTGLRCLCNTGTHTCCTHFILYVCVCVLFSACVCKMCLCWFTIGAAVHLRVSWGPKWLTWPPSVEEIPRADSRNTGTTPQQQVLKFTYGDLQDAESFLHNSGETWSYFLLLHLFSPPSLPSGIRAVRRKLTGLNWRNQFTWVREGANSLIGQPRGPDTSSARLVLLDLFRFFWH